MVQFTKHGPAKIPLGFWFRAGHFIMNFETYPGVCHLVWHEFSLGVIELRSLSDVQVSAFGVDSFGN